MDSTIKRLVHDMAEVVTVESAKPAVRTVTVKLTASEARDVQTFIDAYYKTYGFGSASYQAKTHPLHRAIEDALTGVKPRLDGISVANGKVSFL